MKYFVLNKEMIYNHPRVTLLTETIPIETYLDDIEKAINECYTQSGFEVVQSGRVIALRATDMSRLSSAFKAALYLGKYKDMKNTNRFLNQMVKAGHSYEPIRGENVLFLFIGVGKPVYDHMVTYSVGRPTRIAGGQRANLPWGYEVPLEVKQGDAVAMLNQGVNAVKSVIDATRGLDEQKHRQQIQVARSLLPVGYVMPPFLMEFSEEALIKNVFRQRLWEKGAQGATVDIVNDMWECMLLLDKEKWETLYDYHGTHIDRWKKTMRTLRDKEMTLGDLLDLARRENLLTVDKNEEVIAPRDIPLYDLLMETVGKLPPSMWEKKQ